MNQERVSKGTPVDILHVLSFYSVNLRDSTDPVADVFCKLNEEATRLRLPVSWGKSHGRRRSQSEMGALQERRKKELEKVEFALDYLNVHQEGIRFIMDADGNPVGLEVNG